MRESKREHGWRPAAMPAFLVGLTAVVAAAQEPEVVEQAAAPEAASQQSAAAEEPAGEARQPEPPADPPASEVAEEPTSGDRSGPGATASAQPPETRSEIAPPEPAPEKPAAQPEAESEAEPSWTERIQLKGDLRYRFETIKKEDADLRYRHRIRARPGLVAELAEGLEAVIQLGTGGADDPVSNNQSLTEAFSSKPIWLDLAYFDWTLPCFDSLSLLGGKMKNPYYKVGKTELLWDPDLNPEGLALRFEREMGIARPFLNSSAFFVQERSADDDTWLLGVQAGVKLSLLDEKLYALIGGGYIDYTNIERKEVIWDPTDSFGNSTVSLDLDGDGEGDLLAYDSDYDLLNGFVEVGGKALGLPWALFGDLAFNTAADHGNTGWLVGALLGKVKEPHDFFLRYIYRQVLEDAVFGLFTDSDFVGGGTNGKGHEWNICFVAAKNVVLAFTYFYNRTPISSGEDYHRTQTDLKLKF